MGWFTSFLYPQFVKLLKPTKDFSGQTIIVTGSNTGLDLKQLDISHTLMHLLSSSQSETKPKAKQQSSPSLEV
jgi:hypothetical protein